MTFLHATSSLEIKSGTDEANADKVLLSVKLCIKSASIKKKNISLIDRLKEKGSKNITMKYIQSNFFEGAIGIIYIYALLSISSLIEYKT